MRPIEFQSIDKWPHGMRSRYICGCRCELCTKANREYANQRNKLNVYHINRDGLVPAGGARAYINYLSKMGVGKRAISAASDVGLTTITDIKAGTKTHIRAQTELRIMQVTEEAVADGAVIPAKQTWKLVSEMMRLGNLTRGEIAQRLGNKTPSLQIRKHKVLASTALKVEKLHREVMAELELEKSLPKLCLNCSLEHSKEQRLKVVARMLPTTADEIRKAWPCFYSHGHRDAGERRLYRDLEDLKAINYKGLWALTA